MIGGVDSFGVGLFLGKNRHTQMVNFANKVSDVESGLSRRSAVSSIVLPIVTVALSPQSASARLESVNRPDLLPSESGLNVIQTEKFLTTGQAKRMNELLTNLEKDTGFRVRVLCQVSNILFRQVILSLSASHQRL